MSGRTLNVPEAWDETTEVLILGSGGAALTAAVTAAVEGRRVTVLEKAPVLGGTTAISGGGVWIPANHHVGEVGVEDSREEALGYLRACSPYAEQWLLETIVDRGIEMVHFLEDRAGLFFRPWPSQGGTIDYRPWLDGAKHGGRTLDGYKVPISDLGEWADKMRTAGQSFWVRDKFDYYINRMHTGKAASTDRTLYAATSTDGAGSPQVVEDAPPPPDSYASGGALIAQLLRACLANGVTLVVNARAGSLVLEDGRVTGVIAEVDGQPRAYRAETGVVVATGGFAHSERLKRQLLTRPIVLTCAAETNEGDGHLMGMAIGAELENIGDAWWTPMVDAGAPGRGPLQGSLARAERAMPHCIMVNRRGRRFVNEATNYYDVVESMGSLSQPTNMPAYMVFDHHFYETYELMRAVPQTPGEMPEWLTRGETLEELAAQLGIDGAGLVATVERFNENARRGEDPDFDRGANPWDLEWGDPDNTPNPSLGPLDTAPFYALEIRPGAFDTKGGLRVNEHAQVISADDQLPIEGLYAAGNSSSGSVPGAYAGPGATLGPALTFGYIAGMHLAAAAGDGVPAADAAVRQPS
jgi:3-oxosteroid 1-dehydrogenase